MIEACGVYGGASGRGGGEKIVGPRSPKLSQDPPFLNDIELLFKKIQHSQMQAYNHRALGFSTSGPSFKS